VTEQVSVDLVDRVDLVIDEKEEERGEEKEVDNPLRNLNAFSYPTQQGEKTSRGIF